MHRLFYRAYGLAKNMDTSYAVLEFFTEAINNHLFCRGNSAVGLSSALIGSGMAFHYQFAKEIMKEMITEPEFLLGGNHYKYP